MPKPVGVACLQFFHIWSSPEDISFVPCHQGECRGLENLGISEGNLLRVQFIFTHSSQGKSFIHVWCTDWEVQMAQNRHRHVPIIDHQSVVVVPIGGIMICLELTSAIAVQSQHRGITADEKYWNRFRRFPPKSPSMPAICMPCLASVPGIHNW